ncbi:MAG: IS4 family transposase [Polyangia bacterium]
MKPLEKSDVLSLAREFERSETGDERRTKRVQAMAQAIAANPGESLPKALVTKAAREGAYKLLENSNVGFSGLLAGHLEASGERAKGRERVLVAHDTTTMMFSTMREGLAPVLGKSSKPGFYLHASLAIGPEGVRDPLGLVATQVWARTDQVKAMTGKEMLRWARGAKLAEEKIPDGTRTIHLMDREGDSYELFCQLDGHDFVIRACQNRTCEKGALFDLGRAAPVRVTRTVALSARKQPKTPKAKSIYPARRQRRVNLEVRAVPVTIKRSGYLDGRRDLPKFLELNLVHVLEPEPPPGEKPVEWFLFTTLPIDNIEAVLCVVDYYRARWMIEEFFKALKTGCQYQRLQLETYEALLRALAIYIPVAWLLLRLRYLAGECSAETSARTVLTEAQIEVLRACAPVALPQEPTLREALLAVAALGGHIRNNGEPGWLVLGRGLRDLSLMENVWNAALSRERRDQS